MRKAKADTTAAVPYHGTLGLDVCSNTTRVDEGTWAYEVLSTVKKKGRVQTVAGRGGGKPSIGTCDTTSSM